MIPKKLRADKEMQRKTGTLAGKWIMRIKEYKKRYKKKIRKAVHHCNAAPARHLSTSAALSPLVLKKRSNAFNAFVTDNALDQCPRIVVFDKGRLSSLSYAAESSFS